MSEFPLLPIASNFEAIICSIRFNRLAIARSYGSGIKVGLDDLLFVKDFVAVLYVFRALRLGSLVGQRGRFQPVKGFNLLRRQVFLSLEPFKPRYGGQQAFKRTLQVRRKRLFQALFRIHVVFHLFSL